ncbi:MAG: hypothetical protein RLZZ628_1831 [Bacteroidota bacterium]|jgi:outer membrane protein OmpA-like peptidoglycan-associated protein/uncharacterized protein YegP (UPF0339 family)
MYQTGDDNRYYFTLSNTAGEIVLNSMAFETRDTCISAMRSIIRLLPDATAYKTESKNGNHAFVLSEGGRRIAESLPYDSTTEVREAIDDLSEDASDETQYQVDENVTTIRTRMDIGKVDLSSYYDFAYWSRSGKAGFEAFNRNDNKAGYYFHFNGPDGKALLFSRNFDSAHQRDSRIYQIITASGNQKRYEVISSGGKYYFVLKGSNGFEIARSGFYDTRGDAERASGYLQKNGASYLSAYPKPERLGSSRRAVNQYNLNVPAGTKAVGFATVRHEKDHYFLLNDEGGKTILYSQGYTGGSGRDNGLRAVIKSVGELNRWERKYENGKYYFVLRGANRQEIARSADFKTEAEREAAIRWIMLSVPGYATKYGVDPRTLTTSTTTETTSSTDHFTLDVDKKRDISPAAGAIGMGGLALGASELTSGSSKEETPKVETPKVEVPKVVVPTPKVETPKVEVPKVVVPTPKVETPKVEVPKVVVPTPKVEVPKTGATSSSSTSSTSSTKTTTKAGATSSFTTAGGGGGATAHKAAVEQEEEEPKKSSNWWLWLLPLLLLLPLLFWWKGRHKKTVDMTSVKTESKIEAPRAGTAAPIIPETSISSSSTSNNVVAPVSDPSGVAAASAMKSATPKTAAATVKKEPKAEPSIAVAAKKEKDVTPKSYDRKSVRSGKGGYSNEVAKMAAFLESPSGESPTFNFGAPEYSKGSHHMKSSSVKPLDDLARLLKSNPNAHIQINGHIDGQESDTYKGTDKTDGGTLSTIRARCLYKKLLKRGVPAEQMTYIGLGSEKPVVDNDTEENRMKNRRNEVVFTKW